MGRWLGAQRLKRKTRHAYEHDGMPIMSTGGGQPQGLTFVAAAEFIYSGEHVVWGSGTGLDRLSGR